MFAKYVPNSFLGDPSLFLFGIERRRDEGKVFHSDKPAQASKDIFRGSRQSLNVPNPNVISSEKFIVEFQQPVIPVNSRVKHRKSRIPSLGEVAVEAEGSTDGDILAVTRGQKLILLAYEYDNFDVTGDCSNPPRDVDQVVMPAVRVAG